MELSATPSTKQETILASKPCGWVPLLLLEGPSRTPWTSLPASQSRDAAILFCVRVPAHTACCTLAKAPIPCPDSYLPRGSAHSLGKELSLNLTWPFGVVHLQITDDAGGFAIT